MIRWLLMAQTNTLSGIETTVPPPGPTDLDGVPRDELVEQGLFPLAGAQDPPHPLDVLSLAERGADHDGDLCAWKIDALVEDPRRNEASELSGREALELARALLPPDVTGDGHQQVLPRDRVRRGVVSTARFSEQ